MPHRRTFKKGSFGDDLGELVKTFEPAPVPADKGRHEAEPDTDDASIHDRLFEKSWHASRKQDQSNRFSNQ